MSYKKHKKHNIPSGVGGRSGGGGGGGGGYIDLEFFQVGEIRCTWICPKTILTVDRRIVETLISEK